MELAVVAVHLAVAVVAVHLAVVAAAAAAVVVVQLAVVAWLRQRLQQSAGTGLVLWHVGDVKTLPHPYLAAQSLETSEGCWSWTFHWLPSSVFL